MRELHHLYSPFICYHNFPPPQNRLQSHQLQKWMQAIDQGKPMEIYMLIMQFLNCSENFG